MAQGDIDYGGSTFLVKDIKTGYGNPGGTSATVQTTVAGSTLTATKAVHAGRTIVLSTLTGSVVTLPAAAGTGDIYRFVVTVAPTSNSHIVKVANASDTMVGTIRTSDAGGTSRIEAAAGTDDTITMNGTTTGGLPGSVVVATDVATNLWLIDGSLVGSGSLATSLSATV